MTDIPEPTINARALDFRLPTSDGREISLSDYTNKNNVYLFFIREFN